MTYKRLLGIFTAEHDTLTKRLFLTRPAQICIHHIAARANEPQYFTPSNLKYRHATSCGHVNNSRGDGDYS